MINSKRESGASRICIFKMKYFRKAIFLTMAVSVLALVQPVSAADVAGVQADPSLDNARVLPASVATAGIAVVVPSADGLLKNCSRLNPCALSTPARDSVTVATEPVPRIVRRSARHAEEAQATDVHRVTIKPQLRF